MLKPAHNPTDRPVVIDAEGHILGGGEWGAVDPEAPAVVNAVAGGLLNVLDEVPDGADPAAVQAARAAGTPARGRGRRGERPDEPSEET